MATRILARAGRLAAALCVIGGQAMAQDLEADQARTRDLTAQSGPASDLRLLATGSDSRGYEAVGRLDLSGRGFCTGTLIAPDLVLTAAHCLYSQIDGQMIAAERVEFRAGWRNGRAVAYRKARKIMAHPQYDYQGPDRIDRVAWDLALVELEQPIRLPQLKVFEVATGIGTGDPVEVVSYAHDRAEAPSMQEACHVMERASGVLLMDCDADFGASGAPVFALGESGLQIVSVVSAKAERLGEKVSLGTPLDHLADLRELLGAGRGQAVPGLAQRQVSGAKFLRP